MKEATPPARVHHPVFARFYARFAGPALEQAGAAAHRQRLLEGLTGDVIEIGAGQGLNFPHYPHGVSRIVAVEPEPRLRALAQRAAHGATVPVQVSDGLAERLPVPDASFDAAVVCMTLCSVIDQAAALAESYRVLRHDGQLRCFEHVAADSPKMRHVQRLVDATFWPLLCGGCHTGRDTGSAITEAGFRVTELARIAFPETRVPSPAATHIRGVAVRPG